MTKTIGDVIAERTRRYRLQRGWSVRQLAEECSRLGAPQLTAASLANIERGQVAGAKRKRRDVTVEELVILGYALAVPPLLLAIPLGENEGLEITSTATIHPHLAWNVIAGDGPLVVSSRAVTRISEWNASSVPVRLFAELQEAQDTFSSAASDTQFAEMSGDKGRVRESRNAYLAALEPFARAINAIIEAGLDPPPYTKEVVDDLRASGLIRHPEKLVVMKGARRGKR